MAAPNYDNRLFRGVSHSPGGDVSQETVFHYRQKGQVVWGSYEGGAVAVGTLLARVDDEGRLEMWYQQIAVDGARKAGRCVSVPEILSDGRVRLYERWEWTEGGTGSGESVIEEF